jgi:hypothetical protein
MRDLLDTESDYITITTLILTMIVRIVTITVVIISCTLCFHYCVIIIKILIMVFEDAQARRHTRAVSSLEGEATRLPPHPGAKLRSKTHDAWPAQHRGLF